MIDLQGYSPDKDVPMAVELLKHFQNHGYRSYVPWDYFDYYVSDGDDTLIAVKTVKNGLSGALRRKLIVTDVPMKVILVEGPNPAFEQFKSLALMLATTGTGVFVRGVGWVVEPGIADSHAVEPLRYKIAPRWVSQPDGSWLKACTNCGEMLPPDEFYDNPNKTAKDPKRNQCIACMRGKQRVWDSKREEE